MTVESLPIKQLPAGSVVDVGRPLATLGVTPERIAERAAVEWFDGQDDLDDYRAAVLSVEPHDAVFALLAYRHDPQHGTLLIGSPSASARDVETLLRSLGIRDSEVVDRVDSQSPSSASLELSLEVEELQRQVEALEATLSVVTSAMDRLRNEAAESLRTTLTAGSAADRHDRLWLAEAVRRAPVDELSSRQRQVLAATLGGSTTEEIATALGIRADTVRSHLRAVRNRLAHGQ